MSTNQGSRTRSFFQGAAFILLPAAAILPALKFLTVCPPDYGRIAATSVLVVFSVSEILGLTRMVRCFNRRADIVAVGAILCSVVGFFVLAFSLWSLSVHAR